MGSLVPFKAPLALRLNERREAPVPYGRQSPTPNLRLDRRTTFNDVSLARVSNIIENARAGDSVEWADLAQHMLRDPHLFSVYDTRIAPVAGARWVLEPGNGDPDLAQRAADDCREMLESIPDLEAHFQCLLHAIGVGYAVEEIEWTDRNAMVVPSELIWLHPRNFRFDDEVNLFLYADGRAYQLADPEDRITAAGAYGMRLGADRYVVHTPRAVTAEIPASGILQSVANYWWVKQWVLRYWLMGADLAGNPRAIAEYPQSATEEQITELRRALESMAADGVIATANGVKVTIQAPLAQGSTSVWDRLVTVCDEGMSKAVIGSVLNVGSTPNGNRSAAESQFDATTLPRAERDGRTLWSTIERCILRPFLKFNAARYGRMPPIPRGKFILYEKPIAITELAVKTKSVRRNELRSSCGLPEWPKEQGGEDIVTIEEAAQVLDPSSAVAAAPALPEEAPEVTTPEPEAPAPDAEAAPEKASDLGLNGAQIKELKQLIIDVASGVLPRASALGIIRVAFPSVSPEAAAEMMPPDGFAPALPDAAAPATAPAAAEPSAPLGGAATALPLAELPRKPWELASKLAATSDASLTSSRSTATKTGSSR